MAKKVVLFQPSLGLHKGEPRAPLFSAIPIGIASIAGYVREKTDAEISIVDAYLRGYSERALYDLIERSQPDIVGISATTDMICDAFSLANIAKRAAPGAYVIIGGAHASVRPEEIIANESVDAVCVGEGEAVLGQIVEVLDKGDSLKGIKGIWYKDNGAIKRNEPAIFIDDLDTLPLPAYDLLQLTDYHYLHHWAGKGRTISLVTSRGCCFTCEFCHIPLVQGKRVRFKSPACIADEINYLNKSFGIRNISFQDSTFLVNRQRVGELCELILNSGTEITWSCSSRVDTVPDESTLQLMKKAGCNSIFLGVESGNEEILKRVKNVSRNRVIDTCTRIKRNGIGVHCSFIIGLPGEKVQTIEETVQFAKFLKPHTVSFNVAIPYPGTKLYEIFKANNQIVHENWCDYSKEVVIDLGNGLDPDALQRYRIKGLQSFYLRPSYVVWRLLNVTTPSEFWSYARVFLGLLQRKTKYF